MQETWLKIRRIRQETRDCLVAAFRVPVRLASPRTLTLTLTVTITTVPASSSISSLIFYTTHCCDTTTTISHPGVLRTSTSTRPRFTPSNSSRHVPLRPTRESHDPPLPLCPTVLTHHPVQISPCVRGEVEADLRERQDQRIRLGYRPRLGGWKVSGCELAGVGRRGEYERNQCDDSLQLIFLIPRRDLSSCMDEPQSPDAHAWDPL
jgi:hypothetical protein